LLDELLWGCGELLFGLDELLWGCGKLLLVCLAIKNRWSKNFLIERYF